MTEAKVREELREVQYYYSHRATQDMFGKEVCSISNFDGETETKNLVRKYADVARRAPARLLDIYGFLYIQNRTQESIVNELNYSLIYVRQLSKALIAYFAENLK